MEHRKAIQATKYSDEQLYTLMYTAEHEKNAYVCHVKGQFCNVLDGFFHEISSGMRFPSYFGWTWDAFDECITDLEWLKFSSLFIVIDDCELLFSDENTSDALKRLLIKHLGIAIEYWTSQNIPISVYLNQKKE